MKVGAKTPTQRGSGEVLLGQKVVAPMKREGVCMIGRVPLNVHESLDEEMVSCEVLGVDYGMRVKASGVRLEKGVLTELGMGDVMIGHVEGMSAKIEGGGLGDHVAKVEMLGEGVGTGYSGFEYKRLDDGEVRVDSELNETTQS